ncbi:hypothetical protein WN944_016986 [Citrus x changshan-huyou]|uniref:Uncharacterized protein n=1 Tax=Citrus x changshan-huyou TaxID=2935761 RepID=A0AAP0MC11_9ROSI
MNILVSILYYLLFTNFYSILHLYHNTSLFITKPVNSTRISATPPAKVGTDQKLVRCRSSPCHPCHKKNRVDPNPRTQSKFRFHFRPLHRPRSVLIGSSCNAGHLHAILVAGKRLESCRLKP